jgi:hypothetical protein
LAKKPSTAFSHDAEVGVKWKVTRGCRPSQAITLPKVPSQGSAVGKQSTFRASPRLLQAVPPTLLDSVVQVPHELVRLRDVNKHWVDYRDSERTDRMRRILRDLNTALQATRIDLSGFDVDHPGVIRVGGALLYPRMKALYRVFNKTSPMVAASTGVGGKPPRKQFGRSF